MPEQFLEARGLKIRAKAAKRDEQQLSASELVRQTVASNYAAHFRLAARRAETRCWAATTSDRRIRAGNG
jgi:hypothetical protein